jgi:UDP-N-acetylglucosamine--N-acetylmuramyl-(pentapeptide) pyrophosphoryl-undecaprenol N-acetylglucosamine transferase
MPTVLVASGGTGGHLFPALALANELARRYPSTRIAFVGAGRTAGRDAVIETGFEWYAVPGRGLPRRGVLAMLPFAWDLLRGVLASRTLVRRLRPDVVVGFGNYGSVAPLYAAHRRRVPIVLHEANALPGKANRLLARYARAVAVQFDEAAKAFHRAGGARVETVGMPVRAELLALPDAREARRAYGLDENALTLLVMGGSLGARRLNEVVCAALPQLERLDPPVQVVHLCGAADEPSVKAAYEASTVAHALRAFETDMARAYAAANCALCRAGASTVAELAVTGTPSLLVPYPYATEAHQARNADVLARTGAARVVPQADFEPGVLVDYVAKMQNESTRQEMGRSARRLARPDSAARLADLVEKYMA